MRLEFLMCGSPTDAFWSQAAMFRLALDALGEPYADARQVLMVGAPGPQPIPDRWKPWMGRVEVDWTDAGAFRRHGDDAQGWALLRAANPAADLTILCDADTLLVDRIPQALMEELTTSPAVAGVVSFKPPPLTAYPSSPVTPPRDHPALWNELARRILGRPIALTERYPLTRGTARESWLCPGFYINHGFIIATPELILALADEVDALIPQVREVLDNEFCDQIAIAYAVERAGIPHRLLPMRFNFPNIPACDRSLPEELANVVLIHFLRTKQFDRHHVFANEAEFTRLMELPLGGSNAVLRDAVRAITGGSYPFPGTRSIS